MVPGFVHQGLLLQVANFKLILAIVFSKLVRGRYIKQCIALFFYLKQYVYFYKVIASPERAWQSVVASEARQSQPFLTRSLACSERSEGIFFAPRDATGRIAFVLVTKCSIILSLELL